MITKIGHSIYIQYSGALSDIVSGLSLRVSKSLLDRIKTVLIGVLKLIWLDHLLIKKLKPEIKVEDIARDIKAAVVQNEKPAPSAAATAPAAKIIADKPKKSNITKTALALFVVALVAFGTLFNPSAIKSMEPPVVLKNETMLNFPSLPIGFETCPANYSLFGRALPTPKVDLSTTSVVPKITHLNTILGLQVYGQLNNFIPKMIIRSTDFESYPATIDLHNYCSQKELEDFNEVEDHVVANSTNTISVATEERVDIDPVMQHSSTNVTFPRAIELEKSPLYGRCERLNIVNHKSKHQQFSNSTRFDDVEPEYAFRDYIWAIIGAAFITIKIASDFLCSKKNEAVILVSSPKGKVNKKPEIKVIALDSPEKGKGNEFDEKFDEKVELLSPAKSPRGNLNQYPLFSPSVLKPVFATPVALKPNISRTPFTQTKIPKGKSGKKSALKLDRVYTPDTYKDEILEMNKELVIFRNTPRNNGSSEQDEKMNKLNKKIAKLNDQMPPIDKAPKKLVISANELEITSKLDELNEIKGAVSDEKLEEFAEWTSKLKEPSRPLRGMCNLFRHVIRSMCIERAQREINGKIALKFYEYAANLKDLEGIFQMGAYHYLRDNKDKALEYFKKDKDEWHDCIGTALKLFDKEADCKTYLQSQISRVSSHIQENGGEQDGDRKE